ncbi:MAG: helix-turn-helix transcriptional regulator [Roseofilum sp. SID2]|uniref:helix-turn-helix domain-containing protein n=1 Tax=Roseofilum sp. SID2 TaxID=2821498 RepID=UPI001B1586CF|nr:helix-turn-helix transcriptional regulator [Roseofilum sp. SID2]MBP0025786.1 helix-turn-helix transcriptional regulator [Roseofilum sp. SID2]
MNQQTEKRKPLFAPVEIDDLYPLERLRKKETNLTQGDFTKRIGVNTRTYQKWIEKGVAPKLTFDQLRKLRECLKITQEDLEGLFEGYPNP